MLLLCFSSNTFSYVSLFNFSGISQMNNGLPAVSTIAVLNSNSNCGSINNGNIHTPTANAMNNNNHIILKNNNVNGSVETLCTSRSDQPDPDFIKMFVGQVPKSMDEDQLREMFEEFGRVHSINVLRDKVSGFSKGNSIDMFTLEEVSESVASVVFDFS